MKKRIMSLILAFCIVLTFVPVTTAYAEDAKLEHGYGGVTYFTITGGKYSCGISGHSGKVTKIEFDNTEPKITEWSNRKDIEVWCIITVHCDNCSGSSADRKSVRTKVTFHDDECCHKAFHATATFSGQSTGGVSISAELTLDGYAYGTPKKHEKVPATTSSEGTKEYYQCVGSSSCPSCGKKFYDAAFTQQVLNDNDLIIPRLTKTTPNAYVVMGDFVYGTEGDYDPIVSGVPNEGATVTVYYNTENKNTGGTKWEMNKTAQTLDAGTYYMYAELSETENYSAYTTKTVKFEVKQDDPANFVKWPTVNKVVYVNDIIDETYLTYNEYTDGDVTGKFTITGDKTWNSAGVKQTRVTFTPDSKNYITRVINRNVNVLKRNVESVEVLSAITNKEYGTELKDLGLPEEVEIEATGGRKLKVPVEWDYNDKYNPLTLNEQKLVGKLDLSDISNEVKETEKAAQISVKLTPRKVETPKYEDATYTYSGSSISHEMNKPDEVYSIKYEYEGIDGTVYEKSETAPTDAGTYKVTATFTMKYGYKTLEPISSNLTITKAQTSYTEPTALNLYYNRYPQELISCNKSVNGGTIEFSTDGETWSTEIPKGTDAKNYTVYYRIVGDKNHNDVAATLVDNVKINPFDISAAQVTVDGSLTYNGKPQTQKIKSVVIEEGWELTADDYTVENNIETDANENYTLKVTGKGNYTGSAYETWKIEKAKLNVSVSQDGVLTYNMKPQAANPKFTVSGADATLKNEKITFSESANGTFTEEMPKFTDAGTYDLYWKVTADNHGEETGVVEIKIEPKDISNAEITLGTAPTYNGNEQTQTVESVKVGENWYLKETDYTVSENIGTNAGDSYTLKVKGIGNYKGEATKTWKIEKAEQTINIIGVDDQKGIEATYGGVYTIVPTGTVGDVTYEVTENEDVVSVSENGALTFKKAGNAVVTVRAAGDNNYKPATKAVKITVNKATVTIKAADKRIYTGKKAPDLSSPKLGTDYTVEGLIGSDVLEDSVIVKLAYETEPNTQKRGEYAIIPSVEGEDSRYNFEFENGTLKIVTRPADKNYYTITAKAGKNGTISPSGTISVAEGVNQSFTFTPAAGYAIANVKIDGKSIGAVSSYTFTKIKANHTIEVTFVRGESNPNTGVSSK